MKQLIRLTIISSLLFYGTTLTSFVHAQIELQNDGTINAFGTTTGLFFLNGAGEQRGEVFMAGTTLQIESELSDIVFQTANNNRMTVKNNGDVGIGTDPTLGKLHIEGATSDLLYLQNTTGDARHIIDGVEFSGITLRNDGLYKSGIGYSSRPNEDYFFVFEGGTNSIVSKSGDVGISTTNPTAKLDIRQDNGGSNLDGIRIFTNVGSGRLWFDDATESFRIQKGSSNDDQLVLAGNGNVGIGRSNPLTLLDIAGTVRITDSGIGVNTIPDGGVGLHLDGGQSDIRLDGNNSSLSFHLTNGNEQARLQFDNASLGHLNDLRIRNLSSNGSIEFETNATLRMFINSQGDITLREVPLRVSQENTNTTNPDNGIQYTAISGATGIWRTMHSGAFFSFVYEDDRKSYIDTNGDYVIASDKRLKENIEPITNILPRVLALNPVTYRYKKSTDSSKDIGFIAQEVQSLFPEAVVEGEDGHLGLAYDHFGVLAIQAIKEQQTQLDEKDQRITELEAKVEEIDDLKARLAQLEALLTQNTTPATSETTVHLQGKDQPRLEQNAPNPFKDETQIPYYLPKATKSAQLRITDGNGQLLKILELQDTGEGQVTIQTSDLPSGSYQYTLVIDGKVFATRQMVLTK